MAQEHPTTLFPLGDPAFRWVVEFPDWAQGLVAQLRVCRIDLRQLSTHEVLICVLLEQMKEMGDITQMGFPEELAETISQVTRGT
jgi:hypothetical protein